MSLARTLRAAFPTQTTQLCRQGEGDHEVVYGQELRLLFGTPELLIGRAALRAAAVITAVVGVVFLRASTTLVEPASELWGATVENGAGCSVVVVRELRPMRLDVVVPVLVKDICEA